MAREQRHGLGEPREEAAPRTDVVGKSLVEQMVAEALARYGVTREALVRAYALAAEPYERGAVSQERFVATFVAALGSVRAPEPDAAEILSFPIRAWAVPDPRMVELVRVLRGHYKTALLSNNIPEVVAAVERDMRLEDHFDVVVMSYAEGIRKPDPEIYQRCLTRLAVEPSRAIFIDNHAANCRGAEAVGMHAIHFTSYEALVENLAALGVVRLVAP